MNDNKVVKSLDELKKICEDEQMEFFIYLAGGLLRSSKSISYDSSTDLWYVFNEIDDTEVTCKTKDLDKRTNIVEAIDNKCLIQC